MIQLAAGVYDDGDGGLHLVESELLKVNGYADTPANRYMLREAAIELFTDAWPECKVTVER